MAKVIYSEEKLFYDTYVWEKTSYVTFIWRIVKCNVPKERAILPWRLPITRETIKIDGRNIERMILFGNSMISIYEINQVIDIIKRR